MKHTRSLLFILAISVCLSLIGFFVDDDPRVPRVSFHIYEISMMSLLLFFLITMGYVVFKGIIKLAKR